MSTRDGAELVPKQVEIISVESKYPRGVDRGVDLNAKAQHFVSLQSVPRSDSSARTVRRDGLAGRYPP
jgi:hypothetical protein